jgi:uncharacterized protein
MSNPITIAQACTLYQGADSAHDFEHILRVTQMAEQIARAEGGDLEIVRAAALLHDIARHDEDSARTGQNIAAPLDHAEVSAQDARALLLQNGATPEFAERVADAILAHRFRGTARPTSLEAKILFDADKLDSIGAIGVARAYAICGRLNQKLYSEPNPAATATRAQHNQEHTPVDEFHVKLKLLRDRFHTPTAQRIAQSRHAFMLEFFDRLTMEVHGDG